MSYVHVVLFRLREGIDVEEVVRVLEAARPDWALSWTVAPSLDGRKGDVIVEHAVFQDEADLERFRASAPHRDAGRYLAECADWLIGDFQNDTSGSHIPDSVPL